MSNSFRHKGLAAIFETGNGRKVQPKVMNRVNLILTALNAATQASQMAMPDSRSVSTFVVSSESMAR